MFMSLRRHRRAWEDLGRVDPFWAVLSSSTRRHGRWNPAEFFATGDADIAALMQSAEELDLPRRRRVVLDFGCGVGRLTRSLASRFEEYIGVDISEPMVAQAREWNRDCTRCRFILNTSGDLRTFDSASVDLIYSKYVLQHLHSKALVLAYLRDFVRILRPGGLLAFQLPSRIGLLHRIQPRHRLYTLLRSVGVSERFLLGRLELTPMQMRSMPEAEVTKFISSLGAMVVRIEHRSELDQIYYVTH